ncbi:MAG: hypothetical protein QOD46_1205, partial [Actinomycetota bacterium]|nr:hypothetical protein [Actinomycetota bacterium]
MLNARSAAVLSGNKRAFMSTVAPGSPSFTRRQARWFSAISKVPLQSYQLTAAWSRLGDLTRSRDRLAYPGADTVALPVTEERLRIQGFDDVPVEDDVFYTFVERNGRWLVASDTDLDSLGMKSTRQLWDFGPVSIQRSPHFLLLTHPCRAPIGCAHLPSGMLDLAEKALARVDKYWPLPWRHRIVIAAPSTAAELKRILQATFDVNKFVAFAYSSEDIEHGLRFIGRRIILNWRTIANRTSDSVLTILSHELTHVATRNSAGPQIPNFVEEGIAEYVGYNAAASSLSFLDSVVGAGGFDGKLPHDYQFTTGSGRDIYLSYQKGESAVRFFIDRWGMARFVRFYRRLGRQRVVIGTPMFHLDRALHRTIGVGFTQFQKL